MKGVGEWVFSQILSKSLAKCRPLWVGGSLSREGTADEEYHNQGSSSTTSGLEATSLPRDTLCSSDSNQESVPQISLQELPSEIYCQSSHATDEKRMDLLESVENLQIKFSRLLQRLGQSVDNLLVAKVLYRIHLASLIRAGESDLKRINLKDDRARALAREQEETGLPELDFPIRILVLGKTGVGKSATINSIFDQLKAETDAFRPSTDCIQEVMGTVSGIKITFIDTPGFLPPSPHNIRRNKKIMLSVKRFIRKCPPDIVLYCERLDLVNMGYSDFPLLKLMTEIFGSALWFNTILVMTHSSSNLPEGPNGYPVDYESYVSQCTNFVQYHIHQTVSDSKLQNPVLLVENHFQCEKNLMGEKVLPNGQVWKSRFLLLCICTKVLGDANSLLKFRDSIELGPLSNTRQPSLPHLLSCLLRHRSVSSPSEAEHEIDEILLSEVGEEDEYDQLPSIRILTKSQFERLTKSQKKAYLDELDYRETLYLKKKLNVECRRRKENKLSKDENLPEDDNLDELASPEALLLPDMVVPPSFDSDNPVHRYRCLITNEQWLARPVFDPQGWDHDVGFDGINLETAGEMRKNVFASISVQTSKDKQVFSIQSECAAAYMLPLGPTYSIGLDVQSAGKDLIYTVHSNAKLRTLKYNVTDCGISFTSIGDKCYVGGKLEDTITVGKRIKFVMNAGEMGGLGQVAYGGSFEATLRGRDYPVRNENVSLMMTILSFNKEVVLGGGFQSEFSLSRGIKVAMNANLNSQKMGRVSIKLNSSEHMEIALVAIFSLFKGLFGGKANENRRREAMETG
ncbi:AIG1 domain-containing protein/DUF3406 domain-containing protein [Cephalotus follicularis]|uniref:AIG1 domain-containing protein/DUF3406 domain-containing protein n=1 Tax=Cephalotus follicularis TaxID=3775 RepID=A0A1Q3D9N3_CEPFO|nr:AIG1 domain-containing protein/DUF3406 domain-containing protein [Cephalotus follicularis]